MSDAEKSEEMVVIKVRLQWVEVPEGKPAVYS